MRISNLTALAAAAGNGAAYVRSHACGRALAVLAPRVPLSVVAVDPWLSHSKGSASTAEPTIRDNCQHFVSGADHALLVLANGQGTGLAASRIDQMSSDAAPFPTVRCPICTAPDAYLGVREQHRDYFVECANCGVYETTRKAFRHFEYLRERAHPGGIDELGRLATLLKTRARGESIRLDYDTWRDLLAPPSPTTRASAEPGA